MNKVLLLYPQYNWKLSLKLHIYSFYTTKISKRVGKIQFSCIEIFNISCVSCVELQTVIITSCFGFYVAAKLHKTSTYLENLMCNT